MTKVKNRASQESSRQSAHQIGETDSNLMEIQEILSKVSYKLYAITHKSWVFKLSAFLPHSQKNKAITSLRFRWTIIARKLSQSSYTKCHFHQYFNTALPKPALYKMYALAQSMTMYTSGTCNS